MRTLKALAATGRKTAEEASHWLRCHRDDPCLDDPIPQEYALFLCPTGPLLEKLQEFWRESQRQCTRNRAHEVFPHITLCDFFTCEDQKVERLYEALRRAGDRALPAFPPLLPLALHSSASFLGFFVGDGPADVIREFAATFATEASVLAGPGLGKYKPQNMDELALNPGDFIFVDPTQQDEASEGWVMGTSQRTGCRGFLPQNYTERASESDTWVKHRTYTFNLALDLNSRKDGEASSRRNGEPLPPPGLRGGLQALQGTIVRKSVLVVRHGERVDQVFGKTWLQQSATADGKYFRPDLNFPCSLPQRAGGTKDFESDPPLSSCGVFQSRTAGEALLASGIRIASVFASPALRCVQTAKYILEELRLEKKLKIRVEPGIFEWTTWEVGRSAPALMTPEELREANFNVSTEYRPALPLSALLPAESYEEFVERCAVSMRRIVSSCPAEAGVILIVAHGSALDSCTRPLLGLPPRDCGDFTQLVRKVPSLGMCLCEESKEDGRWELVSPPVRTLTHSANAAFSWRDWIPGP
ncbi:PREDICTED: ubiquitin-associated and SH3 domain-containing protein A [Condylura cristata]|uniref:ubiquitin-associated and SH3 domain-containing protein A n=1 Tax=Condylura cristata TaxID=143302 RepID=UPI0006436481|nr:PREDICTED: ubiquitin-associated and SH3 domain-containing protein A [Condylura cristata]